MRPGPFVAAELPAKPQGFWKLAGPGAVLVGLAIGAGELVVWPVMTARFGADIAWAAMLGIALQLTINIELGRYTLATGETPYTAFSRLSRAWVPVFLALNVFGWILPGWARACGGALKALSVGVDGPGEPWVWTALTFVAVGAVMFGPRHVYRYIERIIIVLIAVMLVSLVVIAVKIGNADAVADLARGVGRFGYKPAELPTYELFSAIVFAGAGGTANLMFAYYLRDKGWGMGARIEEDTLAAVGFEMEDGETARARWRDWFSHMVKDQVLFFWITNSVTILLFIFAALVILFPRGIVPQREMLVLQEAVLLGELWGAPGLYLFLIVGIACLFSTQLTLLDGIARSCTDLIRNNYAWAARYSEKAWYRGTALTWMIVGTALTWAWGSLPPFMFLLSAGFFGGIAMAVYCPLIIYANNRLLPAACRPRASWRLVTGAVAAFYVTFAATSVWVIGARLIGG